MTATFIKAPPARPRRIRILVSIGIAVMASAGALVAAYRGLHKFSEAFE